MCACSCQFQVLIQKARASFAVETIVLIDKWGEYVSRRLVSTWTELNTVEQ